MPMAYTLIKMCMRGILLLNGLNNCLRDAGNTHFIGRKSVEVSAGAGRGEAAHTHAPTSYSQSSEV